MTLRFLFPVLSDKLFGEFLADFLGLTPALQYDECCQLCFHPLPSFLLMMPSVLVFRNDFLSLTVSVAGSEESFSSVHFLPPQRFKDDMQRFFGYLK